MNDLQSVFSIKDIIEGNPNDKYIVVSQESSTMILELKPDIEYSSATGFEKD